MTTMFTTPFTVILEDERYEDSPFSTVYLYSPTCDMDVIVQNARDEVDDSEGEETRVVAVFAGHPENIWARLEDMQAETVLENFRKAQARNMRRKK